MTSHNYLIQYLNFSSTECVLTLKTLWFKYSHLFTLLVYFPSRSKANFRLFYRDFMHWNSKASQETTGISEKCGTHLYSGFFQLYLAFSSTHQLWRGKQAHSMMPPPPCVQWCSLTNRLRPSWVFAQVLHFLRSDFRLALKVIDTSGN